MIVWRTVSPDCPNSNNCLLCNILPRQGTSVKITLKTPAHLRSKNCSACYTKGCMNSEPIYYPSSYYLFPKVDSSIEETQKFDVLEEQVGRSDG